MLVDYDSDSCSDSNSEFSEEISSSSKPILRLPSVTERLHLAEEKDEFLMKKEIKTLIPPKPKRVQIQIPKLSEFQDEEDDDSKPTKVLPVNKTKSLLSILPQPKNSARSSQKVSVPEKSTKVSVTEVGQSSSARASVGEKTKTTSVPFIPFALMSHNPKNKSDETENEEVPFFSFDTNDEDFSQVADTEVKALVAKETARMELRKRQLDGIEADQHEPQPQQQPQPQQPEIDQQAMEMLLGGNRAKRSRINDIQIIEISSNEVLPDKEEFLRKSLAGQTSYVPTGQIVEKGPSGLAKRKHQISYLSMRAENNVAELEAMWAANRSNKRETKSKYGF